MTSLAEDGAIELAATRAAGQRIDAYRGPEVCKLVGITYRQLDYWARTDLLCPSISAARGSGTRREYSYTDLVELKVIKRLINGGLSLQATRRAIACLRENAGADLASANLVLAGTRSVLARNGDEVVDLVRDGQGVLDINIIPLGVLVGELEAEISQLDAVRPRRRKGLVAEGAVDDAAEVPASAVALGG